ncbi:MAG: cytochrome c [Prolixibacteraceae bacterium]|nr:cytochrome c [Prolixibacteraceae bacterium]
MNRSKFFPIILVVLTVSLTPRCTYHNVEDQFEPEVAACDTTEVSYATQLAPLLQANCVSCHNSNNPSGGMVLNTYEGLKQAANSNRLLGALKHETGFSPMPQGAASLTDCDIAQFEAWISQGLKNN